MQSQSVPNSNQEFSPEALVISSKIVPAITTPLLEINQRRLKFGNTVYQTSQIAGFSTAIIKHKFPLIWCLIFGFFFFFVDKNLILSKFIPNKLLTVEILENLHLIMDISFVIGFLIVIVIWLLRQDRYGLMIIANAGLTGSVIIIHTNKQFIDSVVQHLSETMNNNYANACSIDFSRNTITQL